MDLALLTCGLCDREFRGRHKKICIKMLSLHLLKSHSMTVSEKELAGRILSPDEIKVPISQDPRKDMRIKKELNDMYRNLVY